MALGSMYPGAINGVPNARYWFPEDLDLNAYPNGTFINGEGASNANLLAPSGYAPPTGALWPGNIVQVDTSSSNLANPNVKRPANTLTSIALTDVSTAPTVSDNATAGTFGSVGTPAAYAFTYVFKNAAGGITKQATAASFTPTANHSANVTVPANATATSADVYCTQGNTGGVGVPLAFLGNILAANFNVAQVFSTPPAPGAAPLPANVNTTSNLISGLSGLMFGAVYQSASLYRYAPLDNAVYNLEPCTVLYGAFHVICDINTFNAASAPTTLGQKVYLDSSGLTANLGLLSTTKCGTAAQPDLPLGFVEGFESVTTYGGPGLQQSASYGSSTSATQTSAGGIQVVRLRMSIPYVGSY